MTVKNIPNDSDILGNVIIEGMQDIKAKEIVSINLKELDSAVCDYFIICHGTSNTHANSIADKIMEYTINVLKDKPFSKEGLQKSEWILLDYGNIVVHIFQKEIRDYYNIEKLWGDGIIERIND
ncbi:MAG: ribosome silencing factor [Flavobacteriales bacterium]